ncbi:DUF3566 domain-containing protein [candidate division KSB1 bacterium]|nr:DUF3566 domain-containing protein [candidate division KSB1 bacterium]
MYRIRKIDLGTVAIYSFFVFLIVSLIFVVPIGLIGMLVSNFIASQTSPMIPTESSFNPMTLFSGIFIFVMPVLYGIIGAIMNTVLAFIYNMLSIKLGGIKISLEKAERMMQVQPPH